MWKWLPVGVCARGCACVFSSSYGSPAPWQLKPKHLQWLSPRGALFCITIKDTYGVCERERACSAASIHWIKIYAYNLRVDCDNMQGFCECICRISQPLFFAAYFCKPVYERWRGECAKKGRVPSQTSAVLLISSKQAAEWCRVMWGFLFIFWSCFASKHVILCEKEAGLMHAALSVGHKCSSLLFLQAKDAA